MTPLENRNLRTLLVLAGHASSIVDCEWLVRLVKADAELSKRDNFRISWIRAQRTH